MYLELVEALAIDTDDIGLGDEGMWIDLVDDAEDDFALAALGHDEEHLHVVTRVETACLDNSGTAMGIDGDAAGRYRSSTPTALHSHR